MPHARRLGGLVAVGLALTAVPAAADAATSKARVKLVSIGAPPSTAAPGSSFTLKGKVANTTRSTIRPRVKIVLRTSKTGKARATTTKTLGRLKARKRSSYSIKVKLSKTLAVGRYYVQVCADSGKKSKAACRFTTKRLTVKKAPTTTPVPAPKPPGTPAPLPAPRPNTDFDVLAFTAGAQAPDAGVAALKAAGAAQNFSVTATGNANVFTDAGLDGYNAVVFLNTSGDQLTNDQQAAFERYYRAGGGLVAIGTAVDAEPGWTFYADLIGTRSSSAAANASATIKVADRVHDASKSLPEYWTHTDSYLNYAANVRGLAHVLATVDENTYSGGTMKTLADHPISWCKDEDGGRTFYTGTGANGDFSDANLSKHLTGALKWAAGLSDPVYSDCGATVLANYKQTKISAPPNLNEPIGFDQLPDGRTLQTARTGELRLHEPNGSEVTLAKLPVYTNSEDGLYGPAVDANFATNHWIYLYYAPTSVRIRKCDGTEADVATPAGAAPTLSSDPCVWQDQWAGYFQLSRFKFVDRQGDTPPRLDVTTEQKIMKVDVDRGACCHVAGDIDFDEAGNLWLVTGDDTPAGGGNSGGFSPHNDSKTDEWQAIRVTNATGGTFTLTYNGQTTAPIAYNATAAAIEAALLALSNVGPNDLPVNGTNNVSTTNQVVAFPGGQDAPALGINGSGLTGTGVTATVTVTQEAGLYNARFVDARRSALNTNDLRGKVLRIKVKDGDITANEANARGGAYTVPSGNLFAADDALARPEIYAMGFRNPFRIQVDDQGVAYVTDYSPDSNVPENYRGPAGTGRVEIVRKPANYGWPLCMTPTVPYYQWNFNASRPLNAESPKPYECDNPSRGPANLSRWNTGKVFSPPITQPDIWYSYRDNNVQTGPLGTPCFAYYNGSGGRCPQLFPELFQGGVAPHGAAPYRYDPSNPSESKFPPYWDGAAIFGEFGQDTLRELRFDSNNKLLKINQTLNCGQALITTAFPFECDNPMDMQFGADGNFYLLTYGDGFFNANPDAGMYKWSYVKGNQAPSAAISATPTSGAAPLTVQFSSAGSRDEDEDDSIRYAWDFDGNGTVDSIEANPSHVYTANGTYAAKLTVTDSSGETDTVSTTIVVGNTAPRIVITVPESGDFFEWGQRIPYTVTVTDAEDAQIDCNRVEVTFVLIHETHGHGEENHLGCSGTLQTNAGDASHGGGLAGGVVATYTDNGAGGQTALTGRAESVVQLKRQELEFAQAISGISTTIPAAPEDNGTGSAITSLDPGDWIALNRVYNLAHMNKTITFRYAGGNAAQPVVSDRAVVEIRDGSPTGTVLQTVTLKSTGTNNNTYTSQTFPLDFAGSKQLYLVFRAATGTGAPTAGLGLINWVEFSGPGIGTS